jgi:hypothetical protein
VPDIKKKCDQQYPLDTLYLIDWLMLIEKSFSYSRQAYIKQNQVVEAWDWNLPIYGCFDWHIKIRDTLKGRRMWPCNRPQTSCSFVTAEICLLPAMSVDSGDGRYYWLMIKLVIYNFVP